MNNRVSKQLNEIADGLPLLFKWVDAPEEFTGAELNLTPLGEIIHYEPDVMYAVMMPALEATEHKQQIKDAYKRGGMPAVEAYKNFILRSVSTDNYKRIN